MSRTRWMRRAGASLLAGGGLTAIGLAGPLATAPAQAPSSSGSGSGSAALVVTASSPSPPPAGTTQAASPPSVAVATPTTTTTVPPPHAPPPRPSAPAPSAPRPSAPVHAGTVVVISHDGHVRPAVTRHSAVPAPPKALAPATGLPPAPAAAPSPLLAPSGPNGVAMPPQLALSHFGVVPAGGVSPALAAQAMRFYRIPLFLLPIYQAAAIQYGVPWQVLAGINEVETDYGHDLSVSTAGAVGWMQFMPETWLQYGVDASRVGFADPYNPGDAIFAAARYLRAAGAASDLRSSIYAYNHSDAYVNSVLLRARLIASYPEPVVASLTGLAEGRPPVQGGRLPADPLASDPKAHGPKHGPWLATIGAARNAVAVAVQDGRVIDMGRSAALGNYLVLRDVYGDTYTYAGLGSLARRYHVAALPPTPHLPAGAPAAAGGGHDPKPSRPASAGLQPVMLAPQAAQAWTPTAYGAEGPAGSAGASGAAPGSPAATARETTAGAPTAQVRLFAHAAAAASAASAKKPSRPQAPRPGSWTTLSKGSVVSAGTPLGTLRAAGAGAQLRFAIQPAGDSRTVDAVPVLQNWHLLDLAANPAGPGSGDGLLQDSAGEVFLQSKSELQRQVLADPTISIYACGRRDIAAGVVDVRVLAALAYLSRSGLKPTVSGLRCLRDAAAAPGDGAERKAGVGVDITAINGISIAGHQGSGSVTDTTIRALLMLQARFAPSRIVSLMSYPGAATTIARRDHGDRIHIGFALPVAPVKPVLPSVAGRPATPRTAPASPAPSPAAAAASATISSSTAAAGGLTQQGWDQLVTRLSGIPAPSVPAHPSSLAVPDPGAGKPGSIARPGLRLPFKTR